MTEPKKEAWEEEFDKKFGGSLTWTPTSEHEAFVQLSGEVKFFIATLLEEQEEKHRADWNSTLERLLFNGHGSGNWRRLIEQMRKP